MEPATLTTPDPLALLCSQRACRHYLDTPVPDDDLAQMLEAATHAPSAENRQPWVFVVVRDTAARAGVDELTRQLWTTGGRPHAEQHLEPALLASVDAFLCGGYGGAPVLVVVAADGRDGTPAKVLASSVFPATQNLLLAAAALGYGSAMTTLAAQASDALGALLGLPDDVRPCAVVPIGRPSRPLGPPRRRPVRDVAHLDFFGTPFPPVSGSPEPDAPPPPAPPRS